jgi:hypothetical protein
MAAEMKAEIKRQTQELAGLYEALPPGMAIGGFAFISMSKVRL